MTARPPTIASLGIPLVTRPGVDPVAVRDAITRRDARKVLPAVRYPHRVEEDYQRRLLAYVDQIHRATMAKLLPVLNRLSTTIDERHDERVAANRSAGAKRAAKTRADAAVPEPQDSPLRVILRTIAEVKRQATAAGVPSSVGAKYQQRVARSVDGMATGQIDVAVKEIIRVPVFHDVSMEEAFPGYVRENVALIRTIPADHFASLETKVTTAWKEGVNTRQLTRTIMDQHGVTRSRARLIARDQIGKLNGKVNEVRQGELGLTSYQWTTSGDERVRDMHADLEGTIQKWSDPPVTNEAGDRNHPGEDYQCRCTAEPVLTNDNLEELIAAGQERKSVLALRRAA